jgi:transcriptional regulator with XRE-family HTH domain
MKIKELIKKSGLSQKYISKIIGISRFTLSNWAIGKTSPTLEQAQKLKEVLNLNSIDELVNNSPK